MKKLLLSLALIAAMGANAQVTIWSDNFNDSSIADWTLDDSDGDTFNWAAVQIQDAGGAPVGTPVMRSASYNQTAGPLTPNNWAISPAISLLAYPAGSTVTLRWKVSAIDAAWDAEKYTVYVGTTNTVAALQASPTFYHEATLNGVNTLTQRTLDVSNFAGQTVYVAFRHHDVTDQFTMEVDDVEVVGTALGTEDFFKSNFAMYPNPAADVLNISTNGAAINAATITDINGRIVGRQTFNGVDAARINVANLNAGVYFISVESAEGKGTAKFIKN